MNYDVIVFDKDGTLIDFDAFWVTVSIFAIKDILGELDREDIDESCFLKALGVENGVTDIDAVLCKGTYRQMGEVFFEVLSSHSCELSCDEVCDMVIKAYNKNSSQGKIFPTCEKLYENLAELKKHGKKLFVVTTDNSVITEKCLDALGVKELFDGIYTDDGINPTKPDPWIMKDICEKYNTTPDRILMVGDTATDANFAKNSGTAFVGVGKTENNKKRLSAFTEYVFDDVSCVLPMLGLSAK